MPQIWNQSRCRVPDDDDLEEEEQYESDSTAEEEEEKAHQAEVEAALEAERNKLTLFNPVSWIKAIEDATSAIASGQGLMGSEHWTTGMIGAAEEPDESLCFIGVELKMEDDRKSVFVCICSCV